MTKELSHTVEIVIFQALKDNFKHGHHHWGLGALDPFPTEN